MKFKGTIILLVIFILLGGYVLFFNKKKPEKKSSNIFDIKGKDIVEIEISSPKGDVLLKKVNKRWDIEKPIETSADYDKLEGMERTLKKMLYERVVVKNCKDLSQYGLTDDAIKVRFKVKNGKNYVFYIGDKNPSGDYRYVRKDDKNTVYLVYGFDLEKFKPNVEFLRDKTLAYVNLTDMVNFSLKRSDGNYFFKKEHFNWYMEKPFYARMDDEKIRDMLKKVEFEKVFKNIDEKKDFSKFFKNPYISLEMNYENGDRSLLEISKVNPFKKERGKYFGRNVETDRYFILKKDVVDKLMTPIFDLRSKNLLEFYPFEVNGITLKNNGNTLILKKKDDSTWILKEDNKKVEVKNDRVLDYLGKIRDFKVEGFVNPPVNMDKCGINSSDKKFILDIERDSKSVGEKLIFGNVDKKSKIVYVKDSKFPFIFKAKSGLLDLIFVNRDFFTKEKGKE